MWATVGKIVLDWLLPKVLKWINGAIQSMKERKALEDRQDEIEFHNKKLMEMIELAKIEKEKRRDAAKKNAERSSLR